MSRTSPDRSSGIRLVLLLMLLSLAGATHAEEEPPARDTQRQLRLATTTRVRDSGLLDALLPEFRERTGIAVQGVAVGTCPGRCAVGAVTEPDRRPRSGAPPGERSHGA